MLLGVQERNKKLKEGKIMCREIMTHPEYARIEKPLLALQTSEGCIFVGKMRTHSEKHNEQLQGLIYALWEENHKKQGTIEELAEIVKKQKGIPFVLKDGMPYVDPQGKKYRRVCLEMPKTH